ncbi:hypothetical protein EHS11_19740 [Leptospira ilyithenensis]|uniref:Uncharacterized protein n=1 Tax=Leptospira ilyithenensis TaxID=2484901 RepID=A0A4R9LIH4_9LEPT|nr:hypothetical protein EHS11_19740 [Leptospira ilyithenensis]
MSYDKQAGWGGRLGIGSATTNALISFSQRGNTTISGSANIPGVKGLQLTAGSTTNGSTTVGANYNAGNGPREGWNVGANYDINGGGLSGSVGYTDPNSGLGLTSTVDGNGLSTSAQVNGVNLATNGPDGFNMDEMNWSEQNINLAQDRGNKLQQNALLEANGISDPDSLSPTERNRILGEINAAAEYKQLRDSGKTDAEIAAMSRDQREAALDRINGEVNPETLAIAALASVGTFFGGALAYMGLGGGTSNGATPPVRGQVVEVPARRREDGEDDAGLPVPEDGIIKTGDVSEPLKAAGGFNFAEQMALFFGGVTATNPIEGNVKPGEVVSDTTSLSIRGQENIQLASEYYLKYKNGELSEAQFRYIINSMNSPTFNREGFTSTIDDKLNKLKFDGRTRPDTSGLLQGLPMEHTGFPLGKDGTPIKISNDFSKAMYAGDTYYVKFPEGDSRYAMPKDYWKDVRNAPHYEGDNDANPNAIDVKNSSRSDYLIGISNQSIVVTGVHQQDGAGTVINFQFKDINGKMRTASLFHTQYINDNIRSASPSNPIILKPGEPFGVVGPIGNQEFPNPGPHPHINFPKDMTRAEFLEAMNKKWD